MSQLEIVLLVCLGLSTFTRIFESIRADRLSEKLGRQEAKIIMLKEIIHGMQDSKTITLE